MAPAIGGRSRICDMWNASEKWYWVLNWGIVSANKLREEKGVPCHANT